MSQEVRDRVARLDGCQYEVGHDAWISSDGRWFFVGSRYGDHPIPDTLDACAAAWDKYAGKYGWWWLKSDGSYNHVYYYASDTGMYRVKLAITGYHAAAELRDRWELLNKVLDAREASNG